MYLRISSYVCFGLLVVMDLLYAVLGSAFAELKVQLPFLDFPIFAGEWLMMLCVGVLLSHLFIKPARWLSWRLAVLGYFLWVMAKIVEGYAFGGGYALRNAALFYYPVFAILAAHFFRKVRFGQVTRTVFCTMTLLVIALMTVISNEQYAFLIAGLLVTASLSSAPRRLIFGGLFLAVFLFRLMVLSSGRGCFVGAFAGILYLSWYGLQLLRFSVWKQVGGSLALGLLLGSSLWLWGDRHALATLVSPVNLTRAYDESKVMIAERRSEYVPKKLEAHVFHDDTHADQVSKKSLPTHDVVYKPDVADFELEPSKLPPGAQPEYPPQVAGVPSGERQGAFRDLNTAYNNGAFRLLIWRDMIDELRKYHPVFGFSFGRPQRSVSLEILRWGETEWDRDGWIAPHNSLLHMIYRGGVVGLGLIVLMIFLVVKLTVDFLRFRSWRGGLLVSALISWLIMAQFGVILELPYNAIPFWTLFGVALAYRDQLNHEDHPVP